MEVFFEKLKIHHHLNLPFALYKKPNQQLFQAFLQKNDSLFQNPSNSDQGFVFNSFDNLNKIWIPKNEANYMECLFEQEPIVYEINTENFATLSEKEKFVGLVTQSIDILLRNKMQKVVVSRPEIFPIERLDIFETFLKLSTFYPEAFVSLFFHPKIGIWIGASPEKLISIQDNLLQTVALAGTQKKSNQDMIFWGQKEIEEQQIVTDYIVEVLKNYCKSVDVSLPYNQQAGNLIHIKTDISAEINVDEDWTQILNQLHPTPAVCGLPRNEALQFILKNEYYEREFYAGYLGEWNLDNRSEMYVNLRCMKLQNTQATAFVGCGITKQSNPDLEWLETCNKAQTIKRALF